MVLCPYSSTVTSIWRMPQPITPSIASHHWCFPHWSFWNSSVAYVCNCPHVFHTILGQWTTITLQHSHLQTKDEPPFDKTFGLEKFKWVAFLWGPKIYELYHWFKTFPIIHKRQTGSSHIIKNIGTFLWSKQKKPNHSDASIQVSSMCHRLSNFLEDLGSLVCSIFKFPVLRTDQNSHSLIGGENPCFFYCLGIVFEAKIVTICHRKKMSASLWLIASILFISYRPL